MIPINKRAALRSLITEALKNANDNGFSYADFDFNASLVAEDLMSYDSRIEQFCERNAVEVEEVAYIVAALRPK